MNWFRKKRQAYLPGPVPEEIIAAHREAQAAKHEQARKAAAFRELANNMIIRHQKNGFGEKLDAVYGGRGLL